MLARLPASGWRPTGPTRTRSPAARQACRRPAVVRDAPLHRRRRRCPRSRAASAASSRPRPVASRSSRPSSSPPLDGGPTSPRRRASSRPVHRRRRDRRSSRRSAPRAGAQAGERALAPRGDPARADGRQAPTVIASSPRAGRRHGPRRPPAARGRAAVAVLALARRRARAAARSRRASTDTLVGALEPDLAGDPATTTSSSATTPSTCSCAGRSTAARADLRPRAPARARGLPVGQRAGRRHAARRRRGPVRAARARPSRPRSSSGPGTFINESVRQIQRRDRPPRSRRRKAAGARRRGRRGPQARHGQRLVQGRGQDAVAKQAGELVPDQFYARRPAARPDATGSAAPAAQRPELRRQARLRREQGARDAEGALRLPVPQRGRALIQVRLQPDLTRGAARRARSR